MGGMSRRKGASGELEVAELIRKALGVNMRRRLSQYQSGGCDLEPCDANAERVMGRFAIEVKRLVRITEPQRQKLWQESVYQAEQMPGLPIPVLVFRADRQDWRVTCWVSATLPGGNTAVGLIEATMPMDDWLALVGAGQ